MKVLFFTGKGGVGKSTLASAAAWQLSRGRRVLLVSLDPAHNLGDIFNVPLGDKKTRFSEGLEIREIDLKKRTRNYLKSQIDALSGTYGYLRALNLDSRFSVLKYSPGIEEYALLTDIEETLRDESGFDYIIFDTPPTGLTLRFLALPAITLTWIDRLSDIRRHILTKRYTIRKIRGDREEKTVLRHDRRDDAPLLKLEAMRANYGALCKTLQGESCSFVVVFNPDLLSYRESERLIDGLHDLRLPVGLLIDNKITEEDGGNALEMEADMRKLSGRGVPLQRVRLMRGTAGGSGKKLYDIEEDLTSNL